MELENKQLVFLDQSHKEFPLINNYVSYRKYIIDWFNFKKKHRVGFSYRRFSNLLGLKSPNFMQLVLSGERNLSPELANKTAIKLGLTPDQQKYFLAMVQFEQSKNSEEQIELEKIMLVEKKKLITSNLEKARYEILSCWYHMLVRELVFLPNFEPSGDFISKALNGLISKDEADNSFKLLVEAGFIKMDDKGIYRSVEASIDTGDLTFSRSLMQTVHAQTLLAWGSNLEKLGPVEQELGVLHIPISTQKLPELRDRIRKFQDELIGWLCDENNPDRVIQVGTYMIPFSNISCLVKK